MESPWGFAVVMALMFLIPGISWAVQSVANVAKYDRSLTGLGVIVYLAGGAVLVVVGVSFLLELTGQWLFLSGFSAIGVLMVMEGTSRLQLRPYSVTLQWIFSAGGLALLAIIAVGLMHRFWAS